MPVSRASILGFVALSAAAPSNSTLVTVHSEPDNFDDVFNVIGDALGSAAEDIGSWYQISGAAKEVGQIVNTVGDGFNAAADEVNNVIGNIQADPEVQKSFKGVQDSLNDVVEFNIPAGVREQARDTLDQLSNAFVEEAPIEEASAKQNVKSLVHNAAKVFRGSNPVVMEAVDAEADNVVDAIADVIANNMNDPQDIDNTIERINDVRRRIGHKYLRGSYVRDTHAFDEANAMADSVISVAGSVLKMAVAVGQGESPLPDEFLQFVNGIEIPDMQQILNFDIPFNDVDEKVSSAASVNFVNVVYHSYQHPSEIPTAAWITLAVGVITLLVLACAVIRRHMASKAVDLVIVQENAPQLCEFQRMQSIPMVDAV